MTRPAYCHVIRWRWFGGRWHYWHRHRPREAVVTCDKVARMERRSAR